MKTWSIFSSYGAILFYVAAHPRATGLEISNAIGIQERTVRRDIDMLVRDGYLQKELVGRTNHYQVDQHMPLRRPGMTDLKVGDLLKSLRPFLDREPDGRGG
jgi:predicted ArsR family transcriptional regulator